MKNNINNIYSIISKNINISYAENPLNSSVIINQISEIYNTLPLHHSLQYGIRSSYCLFFDPINQEQDILLAKSNNIQPILLLNHIPQQLAKKEDFYLFNESHKDTYKITMFPSLLNIFQTDVVLIDRPQISSENIEKLKNKSKYDALILCSNQSLGQSINQAIRSFNPNYQINYMESYSNIKHLENLYQQVSEHSLIVTINDELLAQVAMDLNIRAISNLDIEGVEKCNSTKDVSELLNNPTSNKVVEFKKYDFENSFKTYINNLT